MKQRIKNISKRKRSKSDIQRAKHALEYQNKRHAGSSKNIKQHFDNYPFSYQNLFYKLEQGNIKYYVINMEDNETET